MTRKSNIKRHFPCTVLQSPVVLTSVKACLFSTTVSTFNGKAPASTAGDTGITSCFSRQSHTSDSKTGTLVASDVNTGTLVASDVNTGTLVACDVSTGTPVASDVNTGTPVASDVNTGTLVASDVSTGTPVASDVNTGTLVASDRKHWYTSG